MGVFDLLFKPVTGIVGEVIDRILPAEKMSELERSKLKLEIQSQLEKADWKRLEKEVEDRVSARELASVELSKGNAYTNVLAALHRPVWSFTMVGIYVFSLIGPAFGLPALPMTDLHADIMKTVIVFYFGGRSVEKVVLGKKSGLKDSIRALRS